MLFIVLQALAFTIMIDESLGCDGMINDTPVPDFVSGGLVWDILYRSLPEGEVRNSLPPPAHRNVMENALLLP